MFYFFFVIMCFISLYIIWHTWHHYTLFSNGYYKNGGQDIILWCEKTETEIINKLNQKEEWDTLNYDFFEKNNVYYLRVLGIRRFQERSCFSALFKLDCIPNENGTYIVISLTKRIAILYSSAFEPEVYEFFIKKLGCIPKEKVV